jgi:hypothetical protein
MTNSGQLIFGEYNGGTQIAQSPGKYNDGQWHNVVATAGASGMLLYVDGTAVATNANTTGLSYSGYWHVGRDTVTNWPQAPTSGTLNGSVDEVAVYAAQLTPSQVKAHYSAGAAVVKKASSTR